MPEFRNVHDPRVVHTIPDQLVGYYDAKPDWERVYTAEEAADLKGAAIDEALEEQGLPRSGKADEKRARLANQDKEN